MNIKEDVTEFPLLGSRLEVLIKNEYLFNYIGDDSTGKMKI